LIRITKEFIGTTDHTLAVVTAAEDQFMVNEADIVANLKTQAKPSDIDAQSDFSFEDFSALSYLLFKHGTLVRMRLAKAI